MKQYSKILLFATILAGGFASCADEEIVQYVPEVIPDDLLQNEQFNQYDVLKNYVNRDSFANFKLGAGITVSSFMEQKLDYALAVANFDEVTPGNAMKYASIVDNNGSMNFSNVTKFVELANQAGLSVYGHTLGWHAQQNNKYLNGLLADKKIETATRATSVTRTHTLTRAANSEVLLALDFEDGNPFFNGWGNNSTREVVDGALKITNPSAVNSWEAQMAYDMAEPFTLDQVYKIKFKVKGSSAGSISAGFQITSNYASAGEFGNAEFDTEWKEVELTCTCNGEGATRLVFSFGAFAGNIYMDDFQFSKEIPINTESILHLDFEDGIPFFNGWGNNSTREVVDGALKITNPSAVNSWEAQMAYDVAEPFLPNATYHLKFKVKGSTPGAISAGFQITSNYASAGEFGNAEFDTEWKEVELSCICNAEGATRLIFSFGAFAGDIYIDDFDFSIEVEKEEEGGIEVPVDILVANFDDGTHPFGGWGNNSTITVDGGALKINNPSLTDYWNAQMAYDIAEPFIVDQAYKLKFKIKGSAAGGISIGFQNTSDYSSAGEFGKVEFTNEWKEVELTCRCTADNATRLIFSFGDYAGDIYIDDFQFFYITIASSTIPLTPEEKKDTLIWALDNWIKGMMEATAGKVTAWDVINEPLAGSDFDGDGHYDLQSATRGTVSADEAKNNFYWQDYLGDEDYVRIIIQKARQYYDEYSDSQTPLRLFINDFNLESDWDDNAKLKSLIHWINVWEADNVTKIDGIATQMHVSCYADSVVQASKQAHVVKMLELLKESGKLVKISELDMGYVDASGNTVPTILMTEEQHKAMAAYYQFIIQKYFEIIPANQQYGITQWCITDAPGELGTGWRGGEPVGLWDLNYQRKYTYEGFVKGLQGE